MKISIIAAIDEKRGLGKNNQLLFKIPEDFRRMKTLTTGHPIIMGRKTFESIGRALPNRTNIVITHDVSLARRPLANLEGVVVVHSLEEAIEKASFYCHPELSNRHPELVSGSQSEKMLNQVQHDNDYEIFIFGGGEIFKQALPIVDRLYLTKVEGNFHADTFFPEYEKEFPKVIEKEEHNDNEYRYTFLTVER